MKIALLVMAFSLTLLYSRENFADDKAAWFSRRVPVSLAVDIMTNSDVSQEIEIPPEQIESLKALRKRYLTEVLRESRKIKSQPTDANTTSMEDRLRGIEKIENDFRAELLGLLSEAQRQRLQQIIWQIEPAYFLLEETEAAKTMKLTAEQRIRVEKAVEAYKESTRGLVKNHVRGPEHQAQLDSLADIRDVAVLDVLTDDQKLEWSRLTGKPVEVSSLRVSALRARKSSELQPK